MRLYRTIYLLFAIQISMAQNYQTVEEVDDICAQLGFATDQEIQHAVDNIVAQIGLQRNFVLRNCPNINNAVAINLKDNRGDYSRYILYDTSFIRRISQSTQNDWSAISILAHEIGHHLNAHALNNKGSNHKWELEADEFSGFVLAKMGATLIEAQSAIQSLTYIKATSTHPSKKDRLAQIEKGWRLGGGKQISKPTINEDLETFEKAWRFDYAQKQYETTAEGLRTPAPSPLGIKTQSLGGNTQITVQYSRLSMRGREIFGDLVPYGQIWRTGANQNTTITFSNNVTILDQSVSAGTYALYTIPDPNYWTIILYSDAENWGIPREWDNANVVLQVKVPPKVSVVSTESFLIDFDLLTTKSCEMIIQFEKTTVGLVINEETINTDKNLKTANYQKVGLTDFEMVYNNLKSLKRNYDNILIEKLTFNDDILISDKKVKRGSYQLIVRLKTNDNLEFKLVDVASNKNQLFDNKKKNEILLSSGFSHIVTSLEGDTKVNINITDLGQEKAYFELNLNNEKIYLPIQLPTQEKVKSNIASLIAINAANSNDYYSAAVYYLQNDFDIQKAKEWIDKVSDENERFWKLHQKSMIYYKYGLKNEAIIIAKRAYNLASSEGNNDYKNLISDNLQKWQN